MSSRGWKPELIPRIQPLKYLGHDPRIVELLVGPKDREADPFTELTVDENLTHRDQFLFYADQTHQIFTEEVTRP
jgi:hypothetical protein